MLVLRLNHGSTSQAVAVLLGKKNLVKQMFKN